MNVRCDLNHIITFQKLFPLYCIKRIDIFPSSYVEDLTKKVWSTPLFYDVLVYITWDGKIGL